MAKVTCNVVKCEDHSGVITEITALKASDRLQWDAITKIQNRMPAWGTAIVSILTFLLGLAVAWAQMAEKLGHPVP